MPPGGQISNRFTLGGTPQAQTVPGEGGYSRGAMQKVTGAG